MRKDRLRQFYPCRHEERRPVDAMKAQNVLTYQMYICRPEFAEMPLRAAQMIICVTDSRYIIGQRIEPDIDCVAWITRNRNTPFDGDTADRKVFQSTFDKAYHFIATRLRTDKIGVLFIMLEQSLLKYREFEKVALFLYPVQRAIVRRTDQNSICSGLGFALGIKIVTIGAIPPLVMPFVNIPGVHRLFPEGRDALLVVIVCRPNPVIIGDLVRGKGVFKGIDDQIDVFLNRESGLIGRAFDIQPMFIGPGQKEDIESALAFIARDRVSHHRRIEMTQVRIGIDIIDWCRYVKLIHANFFLGETKGYC